MLLFGALNSVNIQFLTLYAKMKFWSLEILKINFWFMILKHLIHKIQQYFLIEYLEIWTEEVNWRFGRMGVGNEIS